MLGSVRLCESENEANASHSKARRQTWGMSKHPFPNPQTNGSGFTLGLLKFGKRPKPGYEAPGPFRRKNLTSYHLKIFQKNQDLTYYIIWIYVTNLIRRWWLSPKIHSISQVSPNFPVFWCSTFWFQVRFRPASSATGQHSWQSQPAVQGGSEAAVHRLCVGNINVTWDLNSMRINLCIIIVSILQ